MNDEDFVELFVEEVGEHLEALNKQLLTLEENNWQPETVNSLMRAAHTIKGAAMLMSYDPMAKLAHAMEDRLRNEEKLNRPVPAVLIDLLLAGARVISEMVKVAVKAGAFEQVEATEEWRELTEEILHAELTDGDAPAPATRTPSQDREAAKLAEMEAQLDAALARAAAASDAPEAAPAAPGQDKPKKKKGRKRPGKRRADDDPDAGEEDRPGASERKTDTGHKEHIKIPVEKVDQLNDLVGELLIYQAKLEQKEETLRDMTRRLENLVSMSERARLIGLAPLPPEVQAIQEDLSEYVEDLSGDLVELNYLSADIRRRSLQIRMLPANTLLQEFRLAVRDLRRRLNKEVELVVEGGEIELDKRLLEELRPALLHLIRNCMDHGIEMPEVRRAAGKSVEGNIRLRISVEGARVHIEIEDDGKGMDAEVIKDRAVRFGIITPETAATISDEEALYLVMQPGFSTSETVTDVSGRGVGMDVVRTQVEDLKGSIRIETQPGRGSRFLLDLPLTLSTAQVLMVEVAGQILAIPIGYVEETLLLDPADVFREGGHPVFRLRDRTISIYQMSQFLGGLESRASPRHHQFLAVVILQGRGQRVGFQVARFLEQSEVVVKTLGSFVDSVAFISGATILGDGKPSLILDVPDLLSSLALQRTSSTLRIPGVGGVFSMDANRGASKVLVVDDSITTRALQKGILENEGYEVHTAACARDALRILDEERFDLLLTDVEMPEMDGFQLTEKVRANPELGNLPIIICSVKGSEDDRLKGMRLGAQAYLVKREFDQDEFCSVVRQLIR